MDNGAWIKLFYYNNVWKNAMKKILLILIFVFLISLTSVYAGNLTNYTVACYQMNNATYTSNNHVNDTTNRYNGTNSGANFVEGNGTSFDEATSDAVTITDNNAFDGALQNLTIISRINFNYPSIAANKGIINKGATENRALNIVNAGQTGISWFFEDTCAGAGTIRGATATDSNHLTQSSNTTYFFVFNGSAPASSRLKMYRNSTEMTVTTTGTPPTSIPNCAVDIIIGKVGWGNALGMMMSSFIYLNTTIGISETKEFVDGGAFDKCSKLLAVVVPEVSDTTRPIVNTTFNVTSAKVTDIVNYTANITDETGLLSANWTVNLSSGTIFANYTLSGTSAQISNSTSLSSCLETCVLNFTIYVTDTSNNVKQNSTLLVVSDVTNPIVNTTFNITSPKINYVINFTANVSDVGLSTANITYNMSPSSNTAGVLTKVNFTLSGTSAQVSNATLITCGRGCVINFTMYVTDLSNNVKQNSTLITVSPTTLATPTIIKPELNKLYSSNFLHFNITYPAVDDSEALTSVTWWVNNTVNQTIVINGNKGNTTFNASDGKYNLSVSYCTAFNCSQNATISSFKLDTVNPLDINLTTAIANLTFINKNTNFTIGCSDTNLEGHNISVYSGDEIGGTLKYSSESTGITSTENAFNIEINTSWGDGRYTITSNCSDDHTSSIIPNYTFLINSSSLKYEIPDGNIITIHSKLLSYTYLFIERFLKLNTTRLSDRYIFNLSLLEGITLPFNITIPMQFESNYPLTLRNTKYSAHFISRNNWIDCGQNYATKISKIDNYNYNVNISLNKLSLVCESIGGVNRLGARTQIEIDTVIPTVNDFNISNFRGIFFNNTFVQNTFNVSSNVSDKNNNSINVYIDSILNKSIGYISNTTINLSFSGIGEGNHTLFLSVNDSAGNVVNSSYVTVIIDTTSPSVITFNQSNNTFTKGNIINLSFNVSERYAQNVTLYIDNIRNITTTYNSNISLNFSVNISIDGNYTFTLEFGDLSSNKINSTSRLMVIDTKAPTFISASNRTADRDNSTSITTATKINLTVFGIDDLYLDRGNFSENCTSTNRSWINHSITIINNRTTYFNILENNNFSANQVCGWKFYFYDIAGNELDPINTFIINAVTIPQTSGGGSGGGYINIPQTLSNPFGTESKDGICSEKEQLFDGRCYACDSEIGYLQFNPNDRSVLCIQCNAGFKLNKETKKCELLTAIFTPSNINIYIDKTARAISKTFKTDNLLIGYMVIGISLFLFGYYGVQWFQKREHG